MAITLTTSELSTLQGMEAQAQSKQIGYWQIYQWLGNLLDSKGVPATDSSSLWLRGATEANANRGAMAALIRSYTDTEYQLRYGTSIPTGKMQEASDAVAQNLLDDLLGRNPSEWPRGQVPDINRIALADANAVGEALFKFAGDTAAPPINAAWSGTLLFGLLRSDQTGKLMSTGDGGSIDTLNDWRDVLFSAAAYSKGLKAAWTAYWAGDEYQKDRDFKVLDQTVTGYLLSSGDPASLAGAVINGTANPTLKAAFKVIGDVGQNKYLDMLMGAIQGKPLLGSTTDANFASKANTFFSAYGTTLQAISAELLPITAGGMASKAQTDVNVRAALAALSVVSVGVSATTPCTNAAQLSWRTAATVVTESGRPPPTAIRRKST